MALRSPAPRPTGLVSTLAATLVLESLQAPPALRLGQEVQVEDGYVLPSQRIQDLFATDKNFATLDQVNPTGTHFFVPHITELTTLERMAEPTLRLAMLEMRPRADRPWHLDTYGIDGLRLYDLAGRAFRDVELPPRRFRQRPDLVPRGRPAWLPASPA